ncbi:hypothetical protein M378DRAFT_116834 [Amanita muscaria Koide BX008]|uniref:AAA+ ATPase domain-containing protein n=1 Tax=Amanita muscaria (strain Koide BX008) TaxID=946122 RepID=A0A0C2TS05_AMAMK|nr:hypothetical protein M378DRAFT_116834 [Amanita muscaria Koide BX008]
MLGRKKGASKNRPLDTNQRTLLDLFPVKRLRKSSSSQTETPASESRDSEKGGSDVEIVDSYSDIEHGAISDGIAPVDLPPSSPMVLSEASSTPNILPILVDDGELEPQPLASAISDDDEVQCLSPGGSQEDPIVIGSPTITKEPPKQLWSIFAPRIKEPEVPEPATPTKRLQSSLTPPFPDADSQHVRGAQTAFPTGLTFSGRRSRNIDTGDVQGGIHAFLRDDSCCNRRAEFKVRPCSSEDDKAAYLSAIPKEHRECHPAIDNAMTSSAPTSTSQLWTDKWRPRRAAQVLGNEQGALYLRDWLHALALDLGEGTVHEEASDSKRKGKSARSTKRRRVVRAVDKRKRRRIDSEDEEDSWIVDDDVSEEDAVSDDADELNLRQPSDNTDTPSSQTSHEHGRPVYTFEQLTNTIVLTGPPGSGKTACVYACAEELNWDVFEVYPGIGKRSGASLESMIGDVGKNHLVRTAAPNRATIPTTRSQEDNLDSRARSLTRDFGFLESTESGQSDTLTVTPRQSLVLLEEVDILFKEDTNFWPTVVNFLKDCKRPVICTCNDMSLIPSTDLPLQNVLVFQPCPSPVAVSYLQAVCCNEGWSVDPEPLTRLYETSYEDENEEHPQLSAPDLRRTLHRVQFCCTTSHDDHHSEAHELAACSPGSRLRKSDQESKANEDRESFQRALKHSEALSFLDSEMKWSQSSGEISDGDSAASVYDGRGHIILDEERPNSYADRSTVITSTATRLARGTARGERTKGDLFGSAGDLFRARVDYQSQIGKGLGKLVPWATVTLKRESIYTEYGPYVRQMIMAEDEEEKEWEAGRERGEGRRTRNSNRYRRIIGVSVSERRLLGIDAVGYVCT